MNSHKSPYTQAEKQLAMLIALEMAINPPKTKEAIQAFLDEQPVNNRIKILACHLLHEMAQDAKRREGIV